MAIETVANLYGFFHHALRSATLSLRVGVHDETGSYLAGVLDRFASGRADLPLGDSLVLTLDRALGLGRGEQCIGLQAVGDGALCTLGFLGATIHRAGVDASLYVNLGAFAYGRAAEILRGNQGTAPIVLTELTERFPLIVNVIAQVAESASLGAVTRDLVRAFDAQKTAKTLEALARNSGFTATGRGDRGSA